MAEAQGSRGARLVQWVARYRVTVLFGLNLVLAIAVGYVLEVAALAGSDPQVSWTSGTTWMVVLGVLAAFAGAVVWVMARLRASQHGVVLNVCAGPAQYRERRLAEQDTLNAWIANHYPTGLVLPPVFQAVATPRVSGVEMDRDIGLFVEHLADQVVAAAALAPGASHVNVLPAGVSHAVVQAGGRLAPLLGDQVRILSDVSDDSVNEPFFDFGLPVSAVDPRRPGGSADGQRQAAADSDTPTQIVALLRPSDTQGLGAKFPSPVSITTVAYPVTAEAPAAPLSAGTPAAPAETLAESDNAYELVVQRFARALPQLPVPGTRLVVVSDAPAALVFSAGMVAQRAGWHVESAAYYAVTQRYTVWSAAAWLPGLAPVGAQLRSATRRAARNAWLRWLWVSALLVSIGIPVASGAAAAMIEWAVARSHDERTGAASLLPCIRYLCGERLSAWGWLLLSLGLAATCVSIGWRLQSTRITSPRFVIDASRVYGPTELLGTDMAVRTVRLWRPLLPADTVPQCQRVAGKAMTDWLNREAADRLDLFPEGLASSLGSADERVTSTLATLDTCVELGMDPEDANRIRNDFYDGLAEPQWRWIQSRLVEVITAYPAAHRIEVHIPEAGFPPSSCAEGVTAAVVRGVCRGFRGNQPPFLVCGQEKVRIMPRDKSATGPTSFWEAVLTGLDRN